MDEVPVGSFEDKTITGPSYVYIEVRYFDSRSNTWIKNEKDILLKVIVRKTIMNGKFILNLYLVSLRKWLKS